MQSKHILIVEDEPSIRQMLRMTLERADFDVTEATDVQEARIEVANVCPNLILLDWMMPGVSGVEYARELNGDPATKEIPIIMLTARGAEEDRIRGLNLGCDDYICKPFSNKELVARINAILRRVQPGGEDELLSMGGLLLDAASQRVTYEEEAIHLGPIEYRLLHFFMSHPERVYSREQLLNRVWGRNVYVEERTVDVHIRRLRKALEDSGQDQLIQTVRGSGYRFSTVV